MGIKDATHGLMRLLNRLGGFRSRSGGNGHGSSDPLHHRLKSYEHEIERLRVENEHLRMSALTFGELAERLNKALKEGGGRGRTPVPKGG